MKEKNPTGNLAKDSWYLFSRLSVIVVVVVVPVLLVGLLSKSFTLR